jgi:hypothetical protein
VLLVLLLRDGCVIRVLTCWRGLWHIWLELVGACGIRRVLLLVALVAIANGVRHCADDSHSSKGLLS